ncbi:MAG: adenylate/guanylate cyclase domain-containing protein [Alkalispirochaetaceae bacterium]
MAYVPLTRKVNLLIVLTLILGIGTVTFYLTVSLFTTIQDARSEALVRESNIVYEAIEQLMVPGEAPLVVAYFAGLGEIDADLDVALYRTDGVPAFSDNETIREVNSNLDRRMFAPRAEGDEGVAPQMRLVPFEPGRFEEATSVPPTDVLYQTEEEGRAFARIHRGLINLPKCAVCHGSDHTIRGVIDIRAEITESVVEQRRAVLTASSFFLFIVLIAGLALSAVLRRIVITPVRMIGSVCEAVTEGDFDKQVHLRQDDEIGRLGSTVNTMVQGLKERFHLSRFVSGSTIESIQGDSVGGTATAALLFADIRGFTAYSESHPADLVVRTLNQFLNLQTEIIQEEGGDVDKYVGDEVVAIFTGEQASLRSCRAAVRVQERLREAPIDTGGTTLQIGIGIHYGEVIMGAIGSEVRADFTAIGDNMNTAARLCGAAGGGEIIVTEVVHGFIAGTFEIEGPFRLKVKGKSHALKVYKLLPGGGV